MIAGLKRVVAIARSELARGGGFFDKRTTGAMVATTVLIVLLAPSALQGGFDFEDGLYRVHVEEGSPVEPAVQADARLQRVASDDPDADLEAGRIDLAVVGSRILTRDDKKSGAALAALQEAAEDVTFRRMDRESDRAAAFPVRVEVVYVERTTTGPSLAPPTGEPEPTGGNGTSDGPDDGGTGDGGTGDEQVEGGGESGGEDTQSPQESPVRGPLSFLVPPQRQANTPGTLQPPFPFRSLILAYFFLIPMNFVVQVYAGRVMTERLDRRGEPLLASPATPREIIVGRTLPYLGLMTATTAAIAWWLGGGWITVVSVMPLVLAFLGFEFVAAMFARSFRELTFLTVFISVLLTIYAFLPAVFTDVTPVAFVSPITLVVLDLRGGAFTLAQGLYATLPLTLVAGVCFWLGASLYREEDLFHQKPVPRKLVDAIGRLVHGPWSGFKLSVLLIPFVFVAELLLVTFLFAWPFRVGLVGTLVAVALVEEAFKGVPGYAGISRGRLAPDDALKFGVLAGVGFFLAEKAFLLASLVGIFDVSSGAAVFGSAGAPSAGLGVGVTAALLLAPLGLHVATATLSAWGARRGRRTFAYALTAAVAVHALYNAAVIGLVGGGAGY